MRLKYRFEMPDTAEKEEDDEPADPVFASFVVESWLTVLALVSPFGLAVRR